MNIVDRFAEDRRDELSSALRGPRGMKLSPRLRATFDGTTTYISTLNRVSSSDVRCLVSARKWRSDAAVFAGGHDGLVKRVSLDANRPGEADWAVKGKGRVLSMDFATGRSSSSIIAGREGGQLQVIDANSGADRSMEFDGALIAVRSEPREGEVIAVCSNTLQSLILCSTSLEIVFEEQFGDQHHPRACFWIPGKGRTLVVVHYEGDLTVLRFHQRVVPEFYKNDLAAFVCSKFRCI